MYARWGFRVNVYRELMPRLEATRALSHVVCPELMKRSISIENPKDKVRDKVGEQFVRGPFRV